MGSHSPIAPSSAKRMVLCTGSVGMLKDRPERTNPTAEEGTASHWVEESVLNNKFATCDLLIDTTAPNGIVITEESAQCAQMFVDDVRSITLTPQIETKLPAKRIHPESFGTIDCWWYDAETLTLYIWDYKFGYGIIEVFENWQLINYVAAIFDHIGVNGDNDQHITVSFRIVQPRPSHEDGPIREWITRGVDLRGYFNRLSSAAHEALGHNPVCKTNSECKYCVPTKCEAAITQLLSLLDFSSQNFTDQDVDVGLMLSLIEVAENRISNLKTGFSTEAYEMLKAGKPCTGYNVQPTYGNLTWNKPKEEVYVIGDLSGVDLRSPDKPITPTQAINKGVSKEVVNSLANRPSKGMALKPINLKKIQKELSCLNKN